MNWKENVIICWFTHDQNWQKVSDYQNNPFSLFTNMQVTVQGRDTAACELKVLMPFSQLIVLAFFFLYTSIDKQKS